MLDVPDYCRPIQIAERIRRRKRWWFHGNPEITLDGEKGEFGTLSFNFGDEILSWKIYICDREKILDSATLAVYKFRDYCVEIEEIERGHRY